MSVDCDCLRRSFHEIEVGQGRLDSLGHNLNIHYKEFIPTTHEMHIKQGERAVKSDVKIGIHMLLRQYILRNNRSLLLLMRNSHSSILLLDGMESAAVFKIVHP